MLEMKLFPDLQSVHIHGRNWNSKAVLPLVLMSATRIAKLQLMNMSARQSMDPGNFCLVEIKTLTENWDSKAPFVGSLLGYLETTA